MKRKLSRKPVTANAAMRERVANRRVSGKQIAELSGLSPQRVSQLLRRGQTPAQIITAQEMKRRPLSSLTKQRGGQAESFESARARKEVSLADLRALELDQARGALISRAEFRMVNSNMAHFFQQTMRYMPRELAEELTMASQAKFSEIIYAHLAEVAAQITHYTGMTERQIDHHVELWRTSKACAHWHSEVEPCIDQIDALWQRSKAREMWIAEYEAIIAAEGAGKGEERQEKTDQC